MPNQNTRQYPSRYFFRALQSVCILSASLLAHTAIATTETSQLPVEEIVVTAAKREQLLQDFSGSISVVKTDSLNPGASISDLANLVPGLSVIENGPRNVTTLVMRGMRMDSVSFRDAMGNGSSVVSYVDNIPLQGFFVPPAFSLKDLQQVEVLRGPQGTLYGNASVGGLIRYITAKPDLKNSSVSLTTSVSETEESHGINYDADVVANMPLIADELAARVLLSRKSNQGFIDNKYLLTGPEEDTNSDKADQARASVLWQPSAEFSLSGSYDYQKVTAEDRQASNEEFTGDEFGASNRYAQPIHGVLRLAAVDATYNFDWASVTASVNQSDYISHSRADQTDYLLTLDNTYGWGYYTSYDQFTAFTQNDIRVVKDSAELRFVSPNDQPLRWLAGAFYSKDDLDFVTADMVPGFASQFHEDRPHDLDYYATQNEELTEQSYYTDVAYDLTASWEMAAGVRYFREKDDAEVCYLLFPTSISYQGDAYPLNCESGDDVQSGSLGKLSTKYKITANQSVYASVTQGFRRGGTNFVPVGIANNRSYKADTNINYEVGAHSNFFQEKIKLNAAVFFIDWKDIQVQTISPDDFRVTANAGTARSRGVELDTRIQLLKELSTTLGYSFTDAEIAETVNNIDGIGGSVYVGDRLPGSPRDQWSLGFNYSRIVNSTAWDAALNYVYNDRTTTALNDTFPDYDTLGGYGLVNANTSVGLRNWRFGIYVNNLTNVRAITAKRSPRLFGEQGQFEYITRPRTIGLNVNYHF